MDGCAALALCCWSSPGSSSCGVALRVGGAVCVGATLDMLLLDNLVERNTIS